MFGVGTGDVQTELNKTYMETDSPLSKEWYKRPHNQYLTITVALGLFGLIIFLIIMIYCKKNIVDKILKKNYLT